MIATLGVLVEEQREAPQRLAAGVDRPERVARSQPEPGPLLDTVLFVLSRVAKLSFERTTIAILPWLVPLFITLGLCTYVPEIVLWLPRKFF